VLVRFPRIQATLAGHSRWGLLLVGFVPADVCVPCVIRGSFCRHARSSATVLVGIPGRQATLAGLADGWLGLMSTIFTSC
jgi:hypothetical protein